MPRFVVHEHWALHHHFDLRLELDEVLKSWAVPRGPPSEPGIRRLAVEVDDYPLDHAGFEDEIPEGEYGAGRVTVWDRRDYVLLERTSRKIGFALNGGRLKGDYGLIFMKKERGRRQASLQTEERTVIFSASSTPCCRHLFGFIIFRSESLDYLPRFEVTPIVLPWTGTP